MIDTLTDTDYVSVVDFSSSAVAYSAAAYGDGGDALVPATADNLEAIRTWIDGVRATGTTNFNAAFAKAWDIFRETGSASSGCNKVRRPSPSRASSIPPSPPPPNTPPAPHPL